jgi:hypothetical protein
MASIAMTVKAFTNNTGWLLRIVYTILVFGGANEKVLDIKENETVKLPAVKLFNRVDILGEDDTVIGYFTLNTRVTGDMFDKKYSLSITGDTITASSIEPQ